MKKILRGVGIMLVLMLLLSGYSCEGRENITEDGTIVHETNYLSMQVSDPELQKLIDEVEKDKGRYWTTEGAETHEIISICAKSVPVTEPSGKIYIGATLEYSVKYCDFVSFCYESDNEVIFKTIPIDNTGMKYYVYFSIGEENKFSVVFGENNYVQNAAVYYISLTPETYQSIYAQ